MILFIKIFFTFLFAMSILGGIDNIKHDKIPASIGIIIYIIAIILLWCKL